MWAEFQAPRRRCRVQEEYEVPFPLRRSQEEQTSSFQAELVNQHVLVCKHTHIQQIYSKGYFGKGILSRARPDHSISNQWEEYGGLFLPVISHSRYEELLSWARGALSAQGLDEEAVSQTLLSLSQPVELADQRKEAGGGENGHREEGQEAAGGGACPRRKRLQPGSEVEPEAKRACRLTEHRFDTLAEPYPEDQNPDPDPDLDPDPHVDSDPDPDPDTDPDPDPVDPGSGYVLVVFDKEDDGECGGGRREVRRTPFRLTEYLQLSLEEAFFLVYSLGCLSVHHNQEPLSIIQLWREFRSIQPDFVSSYAAYHHFRSKGWVPKGGAKYGADLMLYRKGPPFYHASYSVVVERVGDAFRGSPLRPFTWRSLAALSRITANVSKELMLCYIIYPADLSESELDSPVCLQRLSIQEVIVSRWISSRERAEQDDV
ncbi:tRNA-splicing endonuclease subunit Sen2 [Centroberyx gerrardi]|uniref:tRNA-splicing endonuclease subunit Sen2 n=1 Tax=Centroberyx gerrardi TaxID=166262 RepID=UPI003AAB0D42